MNLYFNHKIIDNIDSLLYSIDSIKHETNNYKKLELIDSLLALFYDQRLMRWLEEGSEIEQQKADQLYVLYKQWENDNFNWNDSVALEHIYSIFTLQNLTVNYDARDYIEVGNVKLYKNGLEIKSLLFNNVFDINEKISFVFDFIIKQPLKDELKFNLCFNGIPSLNQEFTVNLTGNKSKNITITKTISLFHALKETKPGNYRIELKSNDLTLWDCEYEIFSGFIPKEGYTMPIVFNKMEVIGHDGKNVVENDEAYINKNLHSHFLDIVYIFDVCIDNEFIVDINIDFDYKSNLTEVKTLSVECSNIHNYVKITKRLNTQDDLYDVEGNLFISLSDIPRTTLCLKVFGNKYKFILPGGLAVDFVSCMNEINCGMNFFLESPFKVSRKENEVGNNSDQTNLGMIDDFIAKVEKCMKTLISTYPCANDVNNGNRFHDTESLLLFIKRFNWSTSVRLPFPFEIIEYSRRFQSRNINEVTEENDKVFGILGEKQRTIISTKNGEVTKSFKLRYDSSNKYMLTYRPFFNITLL